jgi:hypothetical protein
VNDNNGNSKCKKKNQIHVMTKISFEVGPVMKLKFFGTFHVIKEKTLACTQNIGS